MDCSALLWWCVFCGCVISICFFCGNGGCGVCSVIVECSAFMDSGVCVCLSV